MKKITYTIGFAFAMLATSNAIAQQGFGTNRPNKSAAVEIKSPNKGLLIPRITLTSDTDITTIANPANSLLIYNETANASLHAGYYYYKESANKWIPFLDSQFQNNTTVTQGGQNLSVVSTPTTNANGSITTDYKVAITPGAVNQFLATTMVGSELQTEWVDYTTIANLITAENGLTKTGNVIKLGGDLTGVTTIDTKAFDLFIKGLSTTTVMTNKVIAVGDATTGKVEVATPQTIIAAGIDNNLISLNNDMTSTVNGDAASAKIINSNDLSLTGTTLTSSVNGVPDSQDLKQAIQEGQIKYEVTSVDGSVIINPAGSTADLQKYDLAVNVNSGVKVKNGISKDAVTQDVILGGDLDRDTTIKTNGNAVMIQGLSQVTSMTDQVVAVGHYQTGEVKVATPGQIVSSTLANGSGTTAVFDAATQTNKVNLGGLLTGNAVITTTTTETLAIAGLQDFTGDEKSIVVLGPGNVLQKASLNTSNAITTVTTNHTALVTDETILVDATVGNVTVTIPPAAAENKGKRYYIKLIATNVGHTNAVIIASTSDIDGDASAIESSNPYQAWLLQSNGTAWFVVGN